MSTMIVIDGDQLAVDIATIRSKVALMQGALNSIRNTHIAMIEQAWESSACEALISKYKTTMTEVEKTIGAYNTFVEFLNNVAENYSLTEDILRIEKDLSASGSAFK